MKHRRSPFLIVPVFIAASVSVLAQGQVYKVPRTEHRHPDFQGLWAVEFVTPLERTPGVEMLVASPQEAPALAEKFRRGLPAVIDPDVQLSDIRQLARVKGEYRTSLIVDPRDGKMPFTKAGLDLAAAIAARDEGKFDNPEDRPTAERCLENVGYAPIRTIPVTVLVQIVQTRDHVVMAFEDTPGPRIIRLGGRTAREVPPSLEGDSSGRWEGDTLVVQTTRMRDDDPARGVVARPLLFSARTTITERFTRVSATELFYRFTVEDSGLYTQPWSGEFSLMRHDGPIYEYSCHEANYSLRNVLKGRQQ